MLPGKHLEDFLYNQMMNQENPGECMDILIYVDGICIFFNCVCHINCVCNINCMMILL